MSHVVKFIQSVIDRLIRREPVLFFGGIGLWITAATDWDVTSGEGIALTGTVLLFQRAYSTSKASAEENVEIAKWVGAVEEKAAP